MGNYKVDPDLISEIRKELVDGQYSFHFYDRDGKKYCSTNCSGNAFHRIVKRAHCVKKTKETGIFQVTLEEACDSGKLANLLERNHTSAFQVIDDTDGARCVEIF